MTDDDPLSGYPAMMTIEQVSEALQVTPRTLFTWRRDNTGPPYVPLGPGTKPSIRYPRQDLRQFLAARKVAAGAVTGD